MGFVNEKITDKEIVKKYNLDRLEVLTANLWHKRRLKLAMEHPDNKEYADELDRVVARDAPNNYYWTIDRQRDIFLIKIRSRQNPDNPLMFDSNYEIFILYINGKKVETELKGTFDMIERKQYWTLVYLKPESFDDMSREEILTILNEALQVYKAGGILDDEGRVKKVELVVN